MLEFLSSFLWTKASVVLIDGRFPAGHTNFVHTFILTFCEQIEPRVHINCLYSVWCKAHFLKPVVFISAVVVVRILVLYATFCKDSKQS